MALGGIGHDILGALAKGGAFGAALSGPATGYIAVYCMEIALLVATIVVMSALIGESKRMDSPLHLPKVAE